MTDLQWACAAANAAAGVAVGAAARADAPGAPKPALRLSAMAAGWAADRAEELSALDGGLPTFMGALAARAEADACRRLVLLARRA